MKKIKLPLEMANGAMVRSLDELKENWDLEKIVSHFGDGSLVTWLNDRYYTDLAEQVQKITATGAEAQKQLCAVFDMEFSQDEVVDEEAVAERKRKLDILRHYTSDDRVFRNVENVAMNQEEVADLLDDDSVLEIYLFNSRFHIPLSVKNKSYVGIGNVTVLIGENDGFGVGDLGLKFENVKFEGEHAIGMRKIGLMYKFGEGVSQDYQKALEWFSRAWNAGDIVAARSTALMYRDGLGVIQNNDEYLRWMKKAVEKGHVGTMSDLGSNYLNGEYVTKDYNEAMKYFKMAAEQGNAIAQCNLGWCYDNGKGCQQDYYKAVEWYKKAAEQGNATAQCNLGWCYDNGKGCQQDHYKAFEWYKKAAEQGYARAQNNLGNCYANGRGCVKYYVDAFEWFEKSAKQGNLIGISNLGWCYFNGNGVTMDKEKAHKLLTQAAEQGDEYSQNALKNWTW